MVFGRGATDEMGMGPTEAKNVSRRVRCGSRWGGRAAAHTLLGRQGVGVLETTAQARCTLPHAPCTLSAFKDERARAAAMHLTRLLPVGSSPI
eukprot:COSAG02_NODE_5290_length_4467_cov_1646.171206_1_plen_93_part_00